MNFGKRLISIVLCTVMLGALLCACGEKEPVIRDDVPVAEIVTAIAESVDQEGTLTEAGDIYIQGYMGVDPAQFAECSMMINGFGTSIDEFGIFKAGEGMTAEEVKAAVEGYLQLRRDSWMEEYLPEEKYKLTDAQVTVIGNYVMYCILSESSRAVAQQTFESCLITE